MTYLNITKFVLINELEKDHSMIEMRHLKNVAVFIQAFLKHFLPNYEQYQTALLLIKFPYIWIKVTLWHQ